MRRLTATGLLLSTYLLGAEGSGTGGLRQTAGVSFLASSSWRRDPASYGELDVYRGRQDPPHPVPSRNSRRLYTNVDCVTHGQRRRLRCARTWHLRLWRCPHLRVSDLCVGHVRDQRLLCRV
jgi:hypothetical protein